MTPKSIDTTIRSINTNTGSVFNIIATSTGSYYCLKDNSEPPQPIGLNYSCHLYLSNGENNEYWAYNQLLARETLILYKAHQKIYQFEEPVLEFTLIDMKFINFHVLDNRWVIVIILNNSNNTVICRTHDILKKKTSQTSVLADLHFPIIHTTHNTRVNNFIYTYTVGNQIIIFTPNQIARLGIQPDDGTQHIRLDFALASTTIFDQVSNRLEIAVMYSSDTVIQLSVQRKTSDKLARPNILVYKNNKNFTKKEYHCLTEPLICLGMINTETLETTTYYSYPDPTQKLINNQAQKFPGVYEYLAPDIIIHRPDVQHCHEQYLTLLVPSDDATGDTLTQIRINIHAYEPGKEQRKYFHVDMVDDGQVFTLIYRKSQDNTWTIYQVDRQLRQIIHMVINKPKIQDIHIEITKTHSVRIYNFNLNRDTIRMICPSTTNMVSILTGIPEPIARIVGQFSNQKIINY